MSDPRSSDSNGPRAPCRAPPRRTGPGVVTGAPEGEAVVATAAGELLASRRPLLCFSTDATRASFFAASSAASASQPPVRGAFPLPSCCGLNPAGDATPGGPKEEEEEGAPEGRLSGCRGASGSPALEVPPRGGGLRRPVCLGGGCSGPWGGPSGATAAITGAISPAPLPCRSLRRASSSVLPRSRSSKKLSCSPSSLPSSS